MIRLAIVTPLLALRAGLAALLSAPDEVEVIAQAATLDEWTLEHARGHHSGCDVLVLTAGAFSIPVLEQTLLEEQGRLGLLILNDTDGETVVSLMPQVARLPLHGWGVLSLDAGLEELQAALRAIAEGLVVMPPALYHPSESARPGDMLPGEALTERESQVLQRLALGLANKQIAAALGISEHTVKFHISSIYNKLGVTNRTEAVRSGVQRGLIYL